MRKLKLEELNRVSKEAFRQQKKIPIIVVLDNIRSGHNVGAAFRTADAFNIEQIILTGISPLPPHKEIFKTAIGATESVSWKYCADIKSSLIQKKTQGYKIIGVEQTDQSYSLSHQRVPTDKIVFIFGNEVTGLSDDLLDYLDMAIEVPQFGTKHSLNVSVCIGVVLWEFVRERI